MAAIYGNTDATILINGQELKFTKLTYYRRGEPVEKPISKSYMASGTMKLDARVWFNLVSRLEASFQREARLWRRLKYRGGRKARSAARRLRAMGKL